MMGAWVQLGGFALLLAPMRASGQASPLPLLRPRPCVLPAGSELLRSETSGPSSHVFCSSGPDTVSLIGRDREDVLVWTAVGSQGEYGAWIDAKDGNDLVIVGGKIPAVFLGCGDDTLLGGGGRNRLWGSFGNDVLVAGAGPENELHGGWGDETSSLFEMPATLSVAISSMAAPGSTS